MPGIVRVMTKLTALSCSSDEIASSDIFWELGPLSLSHHSGTRGSGKDLRLLNL